MGKWIADIEHFTHIKSLHIYFATDDLSFLEGFCNLEELYVVDSDNKEWSFIQSLTSLRYLYIQNCKFSNLIPIRNLFREQSERYDRASRESDTYQIFSGLKKLCLTNCGISDITPLADCKFIDDLNLSHNEISDISPLEGIRSLYYLTLRHNKITDITSLGELEGIYFINLRHNQIKDISALKKHRNSNLSRLFLAYNYIEDFTVLKGIHLIDSDIREAITDSEALNDLLDRKNGKYFGMVLCEAKNIIGKWSQGMLHLTGFEDTTLVFDENGTGYVHWYQIPFEMVDTFNWSIENGRITIKGINRFEFEKDKLVEKVASQLNISNADVLRNRRKGLDGKRVMAIELDVSSVEADDYYFNDAFGFVSEVIWDTDFSKKLRGIIWRE
ncbi:leucine-rich repeat domain-containing protein [Metabacillus sp. B2-18]|uniref:leucine-rich repeat domain-containing protein n=1 Tax=Metabacillus sp. B2-18 TaxID=2897333 RepID=UPI001E3586FD|nr:leucine-rich repeat domain-containing protein [Metabacillus sp. B2-18]UGB29974.1 leucine-rich repeat domain-containing protein [Metabacillus sp. B2-18]